MNTKKAKLHLPNKFNTMKGGNKHNDPSNMRGVIFYAEKYA